jgi:PII-like signaling protein
MWLDDVQVLLRVYLRNTDKYRRLSATDSLVERARRHGVAGATVVRGIFGVDKAGDLLEAWPWSVVQPAPVVVEFVDEPGVVGSFLSVIAEVAPNALITAQEVVVRLYRRRQKALATVTRQECGASDLGTPPWPDGEPTPAIPFSEPGQLLRVFMRGDRYPRRRAAVPRGCLAGSGIATGLGHGVPGRGWVRDHRVRACRQAFRRAGRASPRRRNPGQGQKRAGAAALLRRSSGGRDHHAGRCGFRRRLMLPARLGS